MINYQGQMYGVVKTFGGGRYVDRYEEDFLREMEERRNRSNINVSINLDVNEVLKTIFNYIGHKCNHEESINKVQEEPELIEGIIFK